MNPSNLIRVSFVFACLAFSSRVQASSATLTPGNFGDGQTIQTTVGGQTVWQIASGSSFMYFNVPSSFTFTVGSPVYVQISYYDAGLGKISCQYDSTSGAYTSTEAHTRSSRVGTNQFVNCYQQLLSPQLAGRENGSSDFRLSLSGSDGTPLSVASVIVQDTPFNDAQLQLVLSKPWNSSYTAASRDYVDRSTLKDKVMAGYQGWFATPNDIKDSGWIHWCRNNNMTAANFTTDMWPDLREYSPYTLFNAAAVTTKSGLQAQLFSSASPETTHLHFQWMRKYNIDGAFLQRFLGANQNPATSEHWVLNNVRSAANQEGRIWAIEYDVSGLADSNVLSTLSADWQWLCDTFKIRQDPRYAYEGGKPVVFIWGLPFSDRGFSVSVADQVLNYFKTDPTYGNNYVIGGIPNVWQSMSTWTEHFQRYDGLLVWQTSSYTTDQNTFTSWGKDYFPHIWPGFSWANLQQQPASTSYTQRNGGTYYWNKAYGAVGAGVQRLFIGMFDEYDEGTAVMEMSDDPPNPSPNYGRFINNDGMPSDWWLSLSGEARAMLQQQRALSNVMPTTTELANRSNIGAEANVDLGATDTNANLQRVDTGDGHTTAVTFNGKDCRNNTNPASDFYFYFNVTDAFAFQGSAPDATIELEYFDESGGVSIGLQYDGASGAYTNHSKHVTTAGSGRWRSVRFELTDAYFGNRQNGGADFRFTVPGGKTLHINRVWVRLPAQNKFETELLAATETSGITHRIISDPSFSGGEGTVLDSTATGQQVTYIIPGLQAGTYNVRVGVKKFSTRGQVQMAIARADNPNGFSNVGPVQDLYSSSPVFTELDCGTWTPGSSSDKAVKFTVTGKNAASTGYSLSFDYILFTPN